MIGQKVKGNQGRSFTVIREIGRGSFGVVFLVEDDGKRLYAMKLIAPVSDPAARLSFEQEVQSTLGLTHENLLSVIDYGTCSVGSGQGLFTVSAYCPDGDYCRVLSSAQPTARGIDTILNEFRQILSGLAVLHTKVVHRDLKPENVLVAGGVLKIGDFGLAKFVDEATRTLTFKGSGTPRYMAPEVWLMQHAMPATDLYAVGVMLFEAVTGQPPFAAREANALRDMHLYTPAPRAKTVNKQVPDHIDGIIKKLLEKEPAKRFQTAEEVLEAIGTKPSAGEPGVANLAARMRQHHDAEETRRLEQQRRMKEDEDTAARNRYKEQEILQLVDEVVAEINAQLAETKIRTIVTPSGREYRFGNRVLRIHFFVTGEMYRNPEVPGRMETIRKRHVVHGGYIEIKEDGQDREGWNLVIIRPPESMYGEWRIVETRISALVPRSMQYEPFATEARLFADNLACHLDRVMHVYMLTDKALERDDILKIFDVFIPKS